jgi:hypothetical protein
MSARSTHSLTTLLLLLTAAAGVDSSLMMPADGQSQTNGPTTNVDVTKLGPQVGERVPDFSLPDQRGRQRTLASLMGPKGLVLVFNRSADW